MLWINDLVTAAAPEEKEELVDFRRRGVAFDVPDASLFDWWSQG